MNLIDFSVERPVAISMLLLIIVVLGVVAFSNLGLDLMPDIEYPMVSVVTSYEGAAAEDVESLVTKPVEEMVATVNNIKKVRSISQEGYSVVILEFEWGTDLSGASADIREKLGLLRDFLPEDISDPLVVKYDMSMMPVSFLSVTSDVFNARELRKILTDSVKPRLERLEGVASAMLFGGELYEVQVELDRTKSNAYGVSPEQVMQALQVENLNMPAGHVTRTNYDFLLRTLGEYTDVNQIANTIVGSTQYGTPIKLSEIATVKMAPKERRGYSRTDGKDSIALMISKQSGANTLLVARRVDEELKELEQDLPEGIKFISIWSQGEDIERFTNRMYSDSISGALLAIIFMLVFLRSWRPTLAIGLAIPLSVIVTFIAVYAWGYTLNLMTLGGIALGVGMLVDNAIVVIENIFRHIEEGKDRKTASKIGTREVAMAISASTLTTVVVFLPLLFSKGLASQLSKGLALTVTFSLFASLFVAFTIVPMFAARFFPATKDSLAHLTKESNWFLRFKQQYIKLLQWALSHKKTVIITALVSFCVSLGLLPLAGMEFMPKMDTPIALYRLVTPVGTSLDATEVLVKEIESKVKAIPEITKVMVNAGVVQTSNLDIAQGNGMGTSDTNQAELFMRLKLKEERNVSSFYLTELVRTALPELEGVKFQSIDMGKAMMGGDLAPVQINVFGRDLDVLKRVGNQVSERIKNVEGIRDIDMTLKQGKPEIVVRVDKERALRLGFPTGVIANAVKTAKLGSVATRYHEAGDEYDVRVMYKPSTIPNEESIKQIKITSPVTQARVELMDLANIERREGPVQIDHETQSRKVTVSANTFDRDLGAVMSDVKKALEPLQKEIPLGYTVELAGDYEKMVDTMIDMTKAFLLALLLIYMVMAAQFESFKQPFIIMFTVPLAAMGIIFMLLLFRTTVSLVSALGVLILAGIVVNNGIVMLDYVNQLRIRGKGLNEAIVEGASTRLRPILITAGTTIVGMFPMAFERAQGSEMRAPMALTIVGGLTASTFLTLIVIPVVYSIFAKNDFRDQEKQNQETGYSNQ